MNVTLALDQHVADEIAEAEAEAAAALESFVTLSRRVMELRSLEALRRAHGALPTPTDPNGRKFWLPNLDDRCGA